MLKLGVYALFYEMSILAIIYLIALLALSVFGLHRLCMLLSLALRGQKKPNPMWGKGAYPKVCVQLPIYNEPKVAVRVLRAVSKFEYPLDKLEIQVLDDSTDKTQELLSKEVERLARQGLNIAYIHRKDREGFKAGALQYGMAQSDAEFFAIFDADFIPKKDFLKKAIVYFDSCERPAIGMVQARWEHLNRNRNFLTRFQAVLLDGHFMVEHLYRFSSGVFFNFNGTAGIWRRGAIEDAGGWSGDTLTEDLDLSYRAQLKGWQCIYLVDEITPAELPEDIASFKSQQYRWTKGSAQVCKKLFKRIILAPISLRAKIEALFHLSSNLCYVFLCVVVLLFPIVVQWRMQHGFFSGVWIEAFVLICSIPALVAFYGVSQVWQGRRFSVLDILGAIALGIGMSIHCGVASLSGFFGKRGEFVRTPKVGNTGAAARDELSLEKGGRNLSSAKFFYSQALKLSMKEFLLAVYLTVTLVMCISIGQYSSIPFGFLLLAGYLCVLYASFLPKVLEL